MIVFGSGTMPTGEALEAYKAARLEAARTLLDYDLELIRTYGKDAVNARWDSFRNVATRELWILSHEMTAAEEQVNLCYREMFPPIEFVRR
jgi:hypothetical protein